MPETRQENLTPMRLKNFGLPHVITRQDKNGIRLYFAPQKNLPPSWFKVDGTKLSFRLPISEDDQRLNPNSRQFEIAVRRDHSFYLEKLEQDRQGVITPKYKPYTLSWLWNEWVTEQGEYAHWNTIKPKTRQSYQLHEANVKAFCASLGSPHVKEITPQNLLDFRNSDIATQSVRDAALRVISILFGRAILKGQLETNPIQKLGKVKKNKTTAKRPVLLWTQKDVDDYIAAAIEINWLGGAILVLGMWESMFRITDVCSWRKAQFDGNTIYLDTSKTDRASFATMSDRFMGLLKQVDALFCITQRQDPNRIYNPIKDERQLGRDIERLQKAVVDNGGRRLLFKHLRHSASTHAQECGVSKELIRINTGHVDDQMLDRVYIKESVEKSKQIAKKRGLI